MKRFFIANVPGPVLPRVNHPSESRRRAARERGIEEREKISFVVVNVSILWPYGGAEAIILQGMQLPPMPNAGWFRYNDGHARRATRASG